MSRLYFSSTPLILLIIFFALSGSFYAEYSPNEITNPDQVISNAPSATVRMTNTLKFTPDTVRIKAGETVKWINSSLLAHSVTGDPSKATNEGSASIPEGAKTFNSGMLDPEQTFTHTFEIEGTYQYFCIPHEGAKMFGWVIVED